MGEKRKNSKRGCGFLIVFMIILVAAAGFVGYKYVEQLIAPTPFGKYIEDNPRFVFKTISFRKYLAQGTKNEINPKLFRLQVYQVKATGKYFIDMKNISVNEGKTDAHKKELYLIYKSSTYLPVSVDIDIKQDDIFPIEQIDTEPIKDNEAKKIANDVSIIAGGIGALVGIEIGSELGGSIGEIGGTLSGNPVGSKLYKIGGKAAGGAIGGLLLGLGAKHTVYDFSKNYLVGKHLANGYSISQQEEFLVDAKEIMAAEMLNMNVYSTEALGKLRKSYEKEISEQITKVAKSLGWEKVDVQFDYKK